MIYFDNAATTKPDGECLEMAQKYLTEYFYNPSALYAEGYNLRLELNKAKTDILSCICLPQDYELIITSCGTEADNQAIFCGAKRGNIVTTLGEHSAVYSAAKELIQRGFDVRFAQLNGDGSVKIDNLLSLIDDKTSLVSVIHVSNETGAVNDINSISKAVKTKNKNCIFHSDGVQAFGKIPYRLSADIDMYSISAHKIGALKGCGALIKRKKLALKPFVYGGGQENGLRSGTENVFGIKMLQLAAEKKYKNIQTNYASVQQINSAIRENLDKELFEIISPESSSPYILTLCAKGVRGETILHEVDDKGLIIGTGSACSSNEKKRYSRVVLACGIDEKRADGILRLSFSSENTIAEAIQAAKILNDTVKNRKERMA